MTVSSDFLVFDSSGTNIVNQSTYATDPNTAGGRPTGIWPSNVANKTLRQGSIGAALLGKLIVDYASANAVDDGTLATLEANLVIALNAIAVADAAAIVNAGSSTVQSIAVADATNIVNAATGIQTLWIPASAMQPDGTTYPTGNITQFGTNKFTLNTLGFANGVADLAYFSVAMPTSWNAGTVTAKFHWYGTTGSGSVVFGLGGADVANGGSLDASFGSTQTASSAYASTNGLVISGATPAITIGGTPAAGHLVEFKVSRSASDSFSSIAYLIGLQLTYTATSVFG